jgi:O-antigen/teichoic acid export membrane protein
MLTFGAFLFYTAVTMLVALWSTPRLQLWLGLDLFGAFRVIGIAQGYLVLLELGLGGALAPLLARALGMDDRRALDATVAAGIRGYLGVAVLTLTVGLAMTPIIPWLVKGLVGSQVVDLTRAWLVGLIAFLSLPLLPLRWVIEARQLGYVVTLLLTVQSLMTTAVALLLARAGWGITGQSLALLAGTLVLDLGLVVVVRWLYPGLLAAALIVPPDAATRRALWNLSLPTLLIHLSGRISYLTDEMVIGKILGAERVTSLFNTQRLAVQGQMVLQSVGNAVWAGLAELHARGDLKTFNHRLIELSRLVGVLGVAGLGPVVAYNRAFVARWLRLADPGTYGGDLVAVVAAVNVYFLAEMSLWTWCFSGTGRVRRVVPIAVVGAAANLMMSVLLTQAIGLVGPLLGTTVAVLPVVLWVLPARLHSDFGTPRGALARSILGPLVWGVLSTAGLWYVARWQAPTTYPGLALGMGLSALASLAVSAAVVVTPEERRQWRQRLRGLRPSPSRSDSLPAVGRHSEVPR